MLFGFRGIRSFQVILAIAALLLGVGLATALKTYSDSGNPLLLIAGVVLGLGFLWMFAAALRAPTSFVAVGDERTRIRFAGFVDTIVPNSDIVGARVVRRRFWYGLGARMTPGGASLLTSWGDIAELSFRSPVRIWLIPRVLPVNARTLGLSVRNPGLLAQRFGPPPSDASPARKPAGKMGRRGPRTR